MCKDNMYLRQDILPVEIGGFELDENDMGDWSMYMRIEDSVMRIIYMNFTDGMIKYEPITPDFSIPDRAYLQYRFSLLIEDEINEKHYNDLKEEGGVTSTPYKVINWG